ncbi:MAG: helix-turn-helix domain-containing protein [Hyphomicrobiales bacterium]
MLLAERMGIDRAHVSSMECGQQNATLLTLWHLSETLGVRPAGLLSESLQDETGREIDGA